MGQATYCKVRKPNGFVNRMSAIRIPTVNELAKTSAIPCNDINVFCLPSLVLRGRREMTQILWPQSPSESTRLWIELYQFQIRTE